MVSLYVNNNRLCISSYVICIPLFINGLSPIVLTLYTNQSFTLSLVNSEASNPLTKNILALSASTTTYPSGVKVVPNLLAQLIYPNLSYKTSTGSLSNKSLEPKDVVEPAFNTSCTLATLKPYSCCIYKYLSVALNTLIPPRCNGRSL